MNTRANERLTTIGRKGDTVDAVLPRAAMNRMSRTRKSLALLGATSLLVGCGPDNSSSANKINQPETPSPSSSTAEPTPTVTPTGSGIDPIWTDTRELLGVTSDVVVVTEEEDPTEVVGLSVGTGEEEWSLSTMPPEDLSGADYSGARLLGQSVVMAWKGTPKSGSLEASDEVIRLSFYEADSGEEIASKTIDDAANKSAGAVLGLNGLMVGNDRVFTSNADEHKVDRSSYSTPPPVAVHSSGLVSGPVNQRFTTLSKYVPDAPGAFAREIDLGVRDDRVVRFLVMDEAAQKYKTYYQAFDTTEMKPVAKAEVCEYPEGGFESAITSPSGEYVAAGQAVINLETGDVRCLGDLSESLDVRATALADDGFLYGTAGSDRPFTLEASDNAKPEELEEGADIPVAIFDDSMLFATDEGGISVYERP